MEINNPYKQKNILTPNRIVKGNRIVRYELRKSGIGYPLDAVEQLILHFGSIAEAGDWRDLDRFSNGATDLREAFLGRFVVNATIHQHITASFSEDEFAGTIRYRTKPFSKLYREGMSFGYYHTPYDDWCAWVSDPALFHITSQEVLVRSLPGWQMIAVFEDNKNEIVQNIDVEPESWKAKTLWTVTYLTSDEDIPFTKVYEEETAALKDAIAMLDKIGMDMEANHEIEEYDRLYLPSPKPSDWITIHNHAEMLKRAGETLIYFALTKHEI